MGSILTNAARVLRRARGLRGNEHGGTAIEFALIGMPFFMLLCAVFEAGLVTLAQQSLDNGIERAARQVFSGTFQTNYDGTPPVDRFRAAICEATVYIDCTKVKLEVTTAANFGASSPSNPYDSKSGGASSTFGSTFQCPSANNIVTVRAAAVVPRFFGFLTLNGIQMSGNTQMVVSTAVFRAEPYPTGKC